MTGHTPWSQIRHKRRIGRPAWMSAVDLQRLVLIKHSDGLKPKGVTGEQRFKRVVHALHESGFMPTPSLIRYCCHLAAMPYGESRGCQNGPKLNGREARWRREVLEELGYTKDWKRGRWDAPVAA